MHNNIFPNDQTKEILIWAKHGESMDESAILRKLK
jgi:hypothetical protein